MAVMRQWSCIGDIFVNLGNNKVAFSASLSTRQIVERVRKDPSKFDKYQNNRDFVALLNKFADTTQPIPDGWEVKIDQDGVVS
jgi:hypothetical protein